MENLPVHIALNMTSACNMDCSYCYQDTLNSGKRMTNQVADAVIEMMNKTQGQRFTVSFFGGEPTLASRTIEHFIEHVDIDKVENFSLTTNGTNIDVVNKIARMGYDKSNGRVLTKVLVSNKDQRTPHEELDLEVVANSYRYIISVDDVDNIDEKLVSELLESEFIQVDFRFDYYANWEEVGQERVERVIELLRTFQQTTNRLAFNPPKVFKPVYAKKCVAPHMSIDTDGSIMPCHRMFNSTRGIGQSVGNIVTEMESAVARLKAFHQEMHYSSACIGFNANIGQASNTYVLSLGTVEFEERSETMQEGELQAAGELECR